jgi:hypothetical protein
MRRIFALYLWAEQPSQEQLAPQVQSLPHMLMGGWSELVLKLNWLALLELMSVGM